MINLQEIRDVGERLKPLRRFMDDLALAAQLLGEVEQQVAERAEQAMVLQGRLAELAAQVEEAHQAVTTAKREAQEAQEAAQSAKYQYQAETTVARETHTKEITELQAQFGRLQAEAKSQYTVMVSGLLADQKRAQADYDRVKQALDLLRQQITVN